MFSLLGIDETIKNVYLLSKSHMENQSIKQVTDLKPYYLKFLNQHQPYQPVNFTDNIFVSATNKLEQLKNAYQPGGLDDLNQVDMMGENYNIEERCQLQYRVHQGYQQLTRENKELKCIFDLVIHSVFFRKSAKICNLQSFGGSSSTAMGSIWISGHGALTTEDIAEFLLHELIHHLLFIDERCHQQFNYQEIVKRENYATSALLKKKRPMDKVVHSIIVASEIIIARDRFLGCANVSVHPASEILRKNINLSIEDVISMPQLNHLISNRIECLLIKAYKTINQRRPL